VSCDRSESAPLEDRPYTSRTGTNPWLSHLYESYIQNVKERERGERERERGRERGEREKEREREEREKDKETLKGTKKEK
jgi:hypothetical protein